MSAQPVRTESAASFPPCYPDTEIGPATTSTSTVDRQKTGRRARSHPAVDDNESLYFLDRPIANKAMAQTSGAPSPTSVFPLRL